MKKNLFTLILFIFFFFAESKFVLGEVVKNVTIIGNNRIQEETIIEYGKIIKNKNYSIDELNDIQKNIFDTGFFKNINLSIKNNVLNISVVENPLIDFFSIQGELNDDKTNKLYEKIKLGSNKIYSEYLLKQDLEIIKEFYLSDGYLDIEVTPRISFLEDKKVNILVTINKGEQKKIHRIFFVGDKKFNSSDLLDVISSSENGWWNFLSSSSIVNNDRILYDKNLIKNFYLNSGFYDVQITSVEVKKINNEQIDIVYSINSGELYNFGNFQVSSGLELISVKLQKLIEYEQKKYLTKKYSIKNKQQFLNSVNVIFSKEQMDFVNLEIQEVKNKNNIDLYAKLISTKKYYINKINVLGNSITEESVIRRNLLFSEGDSFTPYKETKSLDNLKALQIFNDVQIKSKIFDENKVDIDIKITEKPTGSISAGAGYGGNGANIGFGIKEENFLGKGINLNTNINFGTQRIDGTIGFTIPDFDSSDRTLYGKIYSTRTTYLNTVFESRKIGSDFSTKYDLYENFNFKPGVGINYEKINVENIASSYLKNQEGNYFTQKFIYNIEKDQRDNKFGTRNGYVLGFGQEYSSFISDIPYLKSHIYGSNYIPFGERQIINIKYGYSNIFSINNNDIRLSDKLFVPYQYAKGFEPRGFGPVDSVSKEFIGGNQSFYSSAVVSFPNPIQESWNLNTYAFINAANIWGTDNSLINENKKIRAALGVGLDWKSPVGPFSISFAKPISKEDTDKVKNVSIEIGTSF